MRDPGSFNIPCSTGEVYIGQALCDLRTSINLMPLSIIKQLGMGEPVPTKITLQRADHSLVYPKGKLEDVLVKVDKFILPVYFIILDYEADKDIPIILVRSFLSIGRTQIDVYKGQITMQVNGKKVKFIILKAMEYPDEINACQIAKLEEGWPCRLEFEINKAVELKDGANATFESCYAIKEMQRNFEPLGLEKREGKIKPSLEQSLVLELKVLPACLKYVFLGENDTSPIII
ncbi:uncharacterized protein LOC120075522 [Benincasa hispida]|uniref:uncharacterized protein LOC120075522 n=1 Tax=Benincasa hispida TaxID=102211 RepID=UPI0019007610|nr:uncharacterized protein LOC120075522 [Benincasa hispida]